MGAGGVAADFTQDASSDTSVHAVDDRRASGTNSVFMSHEHEPDDGVDWDLHAPAGVSSKESGL